MLGIARHALATAALAGLALSSCATSEAPGEGADDPRAAARTVAQQAATGVTTVIAVSVDGLNPAAIRKLGKAGTPTLHRLVAEGVSTLNARTLREQTNTLPNHTGMVTGRRITATNGGHGVTWNDDRLTPRTVQDAAGHRVASVFSVIDSPERDTALFASKGKLSLFERSWDAGIDRYVMRENNTRLVRLVRRDIADRARTFRFVHLSKPDVVGHARGFMSPAYLEAVRDIDTMVGRILAKVEHQGDLADHAVLIITADHGGRGFRHNNATKLFNYRVPFIVWGAGVEAGADLYDLNPDYANPGKKRTTYAAERQPVRNGAVANLVTDLLGLGAVPGSEHDAGQDLDVR